MAKPIPYNLLIHSAVLKNEVQTDTWQTPTATTETELKRIRIEPSSKLVSSNQNEHVRLSALLFFDLVNSQPKNVEFNQGQKVIFKNKEYTIETIEILPDESKEHHYEIGLI